MNVPFTRRHFLAAGAAGLAAAAFGPALAAEPPTRPNIIVLLADDLGFGDLSVYGAPDIATPNIDRLAAEGVRFTDAYAAAPVCSPTRVALMTGRYPGRLGWHCEDFLGGGSPGVDPLLTATMPAWLKASGYATACFGKWDVGGLDKRGAHEYGFDRWVGIHNNVQYFSHRQYDFAAEDWSGPEALLEDGVVIEDPRYMADLIGDLAVDYINAPGAEPFFLYVPWQAPHAPIQPPDDPDPLNPDKPKATDPSQRPDYVKIVERMDYQIGRVLDALAAKGLDGSTLIFFASDNGGHRAARNLPFRGEKQELLEGGIRSPLIMRWPGTIPAGQVCAQPAMTMDITATALAAAGGAQRPSPPLDGIDLLPIVTGAEPVDLERPLYWRRRTVDFARRTFDVRSRAVRRGDWKLYEDTAGGSQALYNLADDPGETTDRGTSEPTVLADLRDLLQAWEDDVYVQTRPPRWGFETDGRLEGWIMFRDVDNVAVEDSALKLEVIGNDPILASPFIIVEAAEYTRFHLRMKNLSDRPRAQLFWVLDTDQGYDGLNRSVLIDLSTNDTAFRDYVIDLAGEPNWRDRIISLRLDPIGASSPGDDHRVEIDLIQLLPPNRALPHWTHY